MADFIFRHAEYKGESYPITREYLNDNGGYAGIAEELGNKLVAEGKVPALREHEFWNAGDEGELEDGTNKMTIHRDITHKIPDDERKALKKKYNY